MRGMCRVGLVWICPRHASTSPCNGVRRKLPYPATSKGPWYMQVTYDELTYNGLPMDKFVPERTAAYVSQVDQHFGERTLVGIYAFEWQSRAAVQRGLAWASCQHGYSLKVTPVWVDRVAAREVHSPPTPCFACVCLKHAPVFSLFSCPCPLSQAS